MRTDEKKRDGSATGDSSAEEAGGTLDASVEITPEQVAPQTTESGKLKRYWLKYNGPVATNIIDPNTGRQWKPGEELEVTEEEGNRLVAEFPRDVTLRSTTREEDD